MGDGRMGRRAFLGGLVAGAAVACSDGDRGRATPTTATPTTRPAVAPPSTLRRDPFTLGVAAGDPVPDGFVAWTRLAPDPTAPDGGLAPGPVEVAWQVAEDEGFRRVTASGTATAVGRHGHSLHVDVRGLPPGRDHWYRFLVGPYESPVGRVRTAPPADGRLERLRLGLASCQAYQSGLFTAHRHLADEDVDAVCFVGDYIYELEASTAVRPHGLPPPRTLDEYRRLWALTKGDADLQAAHAAAAWIVTWDDHEVEDNYAGRSPGGIGQALDEDAAERFAAKRAAAYQAFWEHQPLRTGPPAADGSLPLYRRLRFGDLVDLSVLDDRQYRDGPPPGSGDAALPRPLGGGPQPPGAFAEERSILGAQQEAWLAAGLREATTTWKVLAQQSIMAEMDRAPADPRKGFSVDAWDGFVANRRRLLGLVADEGIDGVVSLGGDIHTSAVTDLKVDFGDEAAPTVATEFIGTSISALELLPDGFVEGARANPHVRLYETQHRGYLVLDLDHQRAEARHRWVDDTTDPGAGVRTGSTWVVEPDRPGAVPG